MSAEPESGLVFFAAAAGLAMPAVESVGPHLTWDAAAPKEVPYA
jgi:hypothetical protein